MLFATNLDMTYDRGEASHKIPYSIEASADKYVTSTGSVVHISTVRYLLPSRVILRENFRFNPDYTIRGFLYLLNFPASLLCSSAHV